MLYALINPIVLFSAVYLKADGIIFLTFENAPNIIFLSMFLSIQELQGA